MRPGGAVPHGGKDKVSPAVFAFLLFIGTGSKRDIDIPDLLTEGGGVEIPGRDEAERGLPDAIARGDRLPKLITDLRTHPAPDRVILRLDRSRREEDQTQNHAEPIFHLPSPFLACKTHGVPSDRTGCKGCIGMLHGFPHGFDGLQITSRIRRSKRWALVAGLRRRAVSAPFPEPPTENHITVGPDETGVRRHQGDLNGHLCPLPEDPEGIGHNLIDLVGADLVSHAAAYASEGVGAGKNLHALRLERPAVFFTQLLDIGLRESRHMRHRDDPQGRVEVLARLEGRSPAARRHDDPVNRKFLRPPSDGLQNGQRIGRTRLREIPTGNL